jgi:hypothetical protein
VASTAISAGRWTPVRAIFALPLALLLPGYALTSAIFRRKPASAERIALALSLSLVTTALASLFLYVSSFGLTLRSWAAALAIVTTGATLAAAGRWSSAPSSSKRIGRLWPPAPRPIVLAIAVAGTALIAGAVILARTPLSSPSARGYTALWLARQPSSSELVVGVRSEERHRTRYVLRLNFAGRITKRHLALAPGQTWQERLPAAQRAAVSLYRSGHPGIYRSVHVGPQSTSGR